MYVGGLSYRFIGIVLLVTVPTAIILLSLIVQPDQKILDMARETGLVIMETGHRMFSACGMLYEAGLRGGAI